jgi:ATP-dependent Lon protease
LQFVLDQADLDADADAEVRGRLRIWWRAAECEWVDSDVSIFRIADVETRPTDDDILRPHAPFEADLSGRHTGLW